MGCSGINLVAIFIFGSIDKLIEQNREILDLYCIFSSLVSSHAAANTTGTTVNIPKDVRRCLFIS